MASLFFFLPLHASCLDLDLHMHTPHSKAYSINKHVLQQMYLPYGCSCMLWVLVQEWPFHSACTYGKAVLSGQALA